MNLESLMESLSDFFMNGGFAGGPNYHPFWGWSGLEDTSSVDALKNALLKALIESGQLTQEMVEELRGEGQGDEAVQQQIAELPGSCSMAFNAIACRGSGTSGSTSTGSRIGSDDPVCVASLPALS